MTWSESSLVHSDPILQTNKWLRFLDYCIKTKLISRLHKFYGIDYNNIECYSDLSESSLVRSDPILQTKEWLRFFRLLHLID